MKKTVITIMILLLAAVSLSTSVMAADKAPSYDKVWKALQGEWVNEDGGSVIIKGKEIEYYNIAYELPADINDPAPMKPKEVVAVKGTLTACYQDKNNKTTYYFKVKGVKIVLNLDGEIIKQDDNYKDDMFFWIEVPSKDYSIVPCEGGQPCLNKKK